MDTVLSEASLSKAAASGLAPASGELSATFLPRLADSVLSIDGPVRWQFAPEVPGRLAAGAPKRWWLDVSADVTCACERCLAPVTIAISSRRGFEFFASAGLLERRSRQLQDDALGADPDADRVDLIPDEDRPTLLALIEDELLLELPMAPKHEICPRDL